jgi:hypothetical protein
MPDIELTDRRSSKRKQAGDCLLFLCTAYGLGSKRQKMRRVRARGLQESLFSRKPPRFHAA